MKLLIIFLLAQGAFCEIICPDEGRIAESPKESNWLRESPFERDGEKPEVSQDIPERVDPIGFQSRVFPKRPKSVTMTLFKRELSPDGMLKGASMYRVCAKSGEGRTRPSITTTLVSVVANERDDSNELNRRKKLEKALGELAKRRRERRRLIIISRGMENSIGKTMPSFFPINIGPKRNGTRRIIIRYRIPMILFRMKRRSEGNENGPEEVPRVRIVRFIPLRRPTVQPQFQATIPKPPTTLTPPTPPPQLSPFKNNSQSIQTPSKKSIPCCFKHLLSLMWPNYTTNPDGFIQRLLDKTNSLFSNN